MKRLALIAATLAAGCIELPLPGVHFDEEDRAPLPPCVPAFEPGQRLTLRVDSVYDRSSDYLYDDTFTGLYWSREPGCEAVDGLDIGSVVTFTLQSETVRPAVVADDACAPYLARFDPEVVSDPRVVLGGTSRDPGVSIATAFAKGGLDGHSALVTRELVSPSGEPRAEPVERELPPLLMIRTIRRDDEGTGCRDAWVMRWEEAP